MSTKRVDPEDGKAYTYDEIAAHYSRKYKKKDIAAYWENTCKPLKSKRNRPAKDGKKENGKDNGVAAKENGKPKGKNSVAAMKEKIVELEKKLENVTGKKVSEFDKYLHPEGSKERDRAAALTLTQDVVRMAKGDEQLAILMNAISHACKVVSDAIMGAGPNGLYGMAGEVNATGDDVKKLDLIADDIWMDCMRRCGVCAVLVSEESEEEVIIDNPTGPFCVAFDPLDGSSNIDCNVSVGSIFSVYRRTSAGDTNANVSDILKNGTHMVAAGYCMYGASCELVLTYGQGVKRFALDPALGEFLYTQDIVMDPNGGKKIFSCNEGNSLQWDKPILDSVEKFKDDGYAARYVGSMVSDVHRTLLYGGIFLYPADKKSVKGKLRVLYEGYPMAMITEQAGGVASTGMFKGKVQRILEVEPEHIHDRCPIIMGAARDVNQVTKLYE